MNINLLLTYTDGNAKELTAKAVDLVAFESRFDLSIARLENNIRMTHLFFLAWHVEHRTGATKDEFEKWLETVETIEAQPAKK